MFRFLQRVQQQTRWRIYVRILPVVFLAVLSVGAFGWFVFTRYATGNLVDHDRHEITYLLEGVRNRILVETMRLEAKRDRKAESAGVDTTGCVLDEGFCRAWSTGALRGDKLWGVAMVGPETGSEFWKLWSRCLADSADNAATNAMLDDWFRGQEEQLRTGVPVPSNFDEGSPVPVLTYREGSHATYLLPPVITGQDGQPSEPLLPVLVRDEAAGPTGKHPVYFLRLGRLLSESMAMELAADPDAWWCVVDYAGKAVISSGAPAAGTLLWEQGRSSDGGPLGAVDGHELVGNWRPGRPWQRAIFGNSLRPWIVTAGQSRNLPLIVLFGHEAHQLEALSLGYIAAVFGVALLAQAISIFGVTRVVGRIAGRLANLSGNMELVAGGDYTRRIPDTVGDEVGRLIGYFNRMAVNLDETHRQLSEKTTHLQAALDNRQVLDRAKDDFLVLISHEVRTPLTAIMGGVDLLKGLVDRTSGPEHEMLVKMNLVEIAKIIESNSQRLRGFMNDAIQMTSIQSSDHELALKPQHIGALVEMGLCGVRELAQVRNIAVRNELEREDRWRVLGDSRVLTLAFEKVLKNAVVHNHDGGQVVIREVDAVPNQPALRALASDDMKHRLACNESFADYGALPLTWRAIEIFNTGEAIPTERCEALFAKFELVGRIEHHQRGSGLSLPIARAAVEQHGGRIFIHSVKLRGNSFYLLLPTLATADVDRLDGDPSDLPFAAAGNEQGQHRFGRAGYEQIGQMADPARLEVELEHLGTGLPRGGD